MPANETKPTPSAKPRKRRILDEAEYRGFVVRAVRNFVRRAADGGSIDSLREMVIVANEVDAAMAKLIHYLRSEEGGAYSWAQVAEVLGITRQAAQQKYGGEGARTTGGQPAHLR